MTEVESAWPQLTIVTAPPGAGKTTLVDSVTERSQRVWLSLRTLHHGSELPTRLVAGLRLRLPGLPATLAAAVGPSCGPVSNADPVGRAEQLGSLIARELDTTLHHDLVLVIDDLESIADDPIATRLVEALVRSAPSRLSIVLAGRVPPPFSVARFHEDGRLREIGPNELALDDETSHSVLDARWPGIVADSDDGPHASGGLADRIVMLAGGLPGRLEAVASVLTAVAPQDRGDVLGELAGAVDPMRAAMERLWTNLEPDDHLLVQEVAVFGDVGVAELRRLGHADVDKRVSSLVERQLIEELTGAVGVTHLRLTKSARAVVVPDPELAARRANDAVLVASGRADPSHALGVALEYGDEDLLASSVASLGEMTIDDGSSRLVLDAIERLGSPPEFHGLAGRAHQGLGDWESAIASYRLAADHRVTARDAWRHVMLGYFQGDTIGATEVARVAIAALDESDDATDRAMLFGYGGSVAWLTGDLDTARRSSEDALRLAAQSRDDAALAVAHTLAAMVAASDGDRVNNDWYYVRALQHAERAGDLLQIARIRSNRASRLIEEGEYEAALGELDDAVRYGDLGGYGAMLGLALTNRGEVLTKFGRLDDARTDLVAAADLLQRQGTRIVAYPLVRLARLFVIRGDLEQARGSCERAIAISDPAADQQLGVAAHVELALALADRDPEAAWDHANRAASSSSSLDAAHAWSVVGMLALDRGDLDAAASAAATAAELARSRRDRFALAHALEVMALTATDPADRRARLDEAYTLFDELRCPIESARIELRLAAERLDAAALARVAAVGDLARRLGARPLLAQVEELLGARDALTDGTIRVTVLGSFVVRRGDEQVPLSAWQSRKARDLFKMLVTRRGRALPREQAIERLWPDDELSKAASKLSVALATVRSVLDPEKQFASDHYVRADGDLLNVDPGSVATDIDGFIEMASESLREHRRSANDRAASMLEAAEAAYAGDVFEDDPYVDWYAPLREEARVLYLDVARALAERRSGLGEHDDAVRLLLRVLEREPYDEPVHLDLIVALSKVGRHGDARRRYQQYAARMRELDIEPRTFPSDSSRAL